MFSTLINPGALMATRVFSGRKIEAAEAFNRVGIGLKIPGALEDASSFVIAQGVRGEVRAWQAVCQRLSTAAGVVKVAETAATSISNLLNEYRKNISNILPLISKVRRSF